MEEVENIATCSKTSPQELATRVKRTYGKKRLLNDAQPGDSSSSHSIASYRTRPGSTDGSGQHSGIQLSRIFTNDASNAFGWKERLALIDRQFDEEETKVVNVSTEGTTADCTVKDNSSTKSTSTEDDSSGLHDETLLLGSVPLTSSQSDPPSPGQAETKGVDVTTLITNFEALPSAADDLRAVATHSQSSSEDEQPFQPNVGKASSSAHVNESQCLEPKASATRPSTRKGSKGSTGVLREQANKVKKFSKKEEKESKKAHARIMADQKISISKRAEQYTVEQLLKNVQQRQHLCDINSGITSSDPIQDFTSSPAINSGNASAKRETKSGPSTLQDTSDDEMPNVHQLVSLEAGTKKKEQDEARRKRDLAFIKQRALKFKPRITLSDSDNDDLEVATIGTEVIAKRPRASTKYEKQLSAVAGFRSGSGRAALVALDGSQGERTMKIAAKSTFSDRDSRRMKPTLDHRDLQAAMFRKASTQSMQITKEKEEEWQRRGGRLAGKQRIILANQPLSLGHLAEELAHKKGGDGQNDSSHNADIASGSDNSSDEDWSPEKHNSRNASNFVEGKGSDESDESSKNSGEEAQDEHVSAMQQEAVTEDDENLDRPGRLSRRSTAMLITSDSENEDTPVFQSEGRVLVPDTSMIINDRRHESLISSEMEPDEHDKENDMLQPFDSGDDKENVMLNSHISSSSFQLGNRRRSGVFDPTDRASRLSLSPSASTENGDSRSARRPLQARKLGELEDPFKTPPSAGRLGSPNLKRVLSSGGSPISLKSTFNDAAGAFTQLFNDEEGVAPSNQNINPTSLLQPAFRMGTGNGHSLWSSPTQMQRKRERMSDTLVPEKEVQIRSGHSAGNDELSLTLDTRLQPALDVSTQVRRKADSIFEREQEFVIDEAIQSASSSRSKHDLYVSENGLLTQTRPEDSTPLLYRSWTSSQKAAALWSVPPLTTQRLPLSTLSLATDAVSPSQQRLTRLVKGKGRAGSSDEGKLSSSSPLHRPPSAFTRLLEGARQEQKKKQKKLAKSDFVEGEAQESDEDELFGFGGRKGDDDDDESDDNDPDAVVEGLVDDAAMDAEQLAEDKILEKVKEQLEEEDAALQKYHQAAVEGKFRSKRRGGGIAMEDSESDDDEDEEARRLRRRMYKKRRVHGDKLDDLSKDEKSRAFYEAYQRDINEEDDDDFAHLASDAMDVEDEHDENEEPETVSTTELQEQLREAARQAKDKVKVFDYDVEWAHNHGTSDDEFDVKEIEDRPKKIAQRRPIFGRTDIPDIDDSLPRKPGKLSDEQVAQLAAWRKEQSGRNLGTGGMRGAITVTGHGTKNIQKGGSMSKSTSGRPQDVQPARRKIMKSASVLASVPAKQSRFGT